MYKTASKAVFFYEIILDKIPDAATLLQALYSTLEEQQRNVHSSFITSL